MYNMLIEANKQFYNHKSSFFDDTFCGFIDMLHKTTRCQVVHDKKFLRFRPLPHSAMLAHMKSIDEANSDLVDYFASCPSFEISVHKENEIHDFRFWRVCFESKMHVYEDPLLRQILRDGLKKARLSNALATVFEVSLDYAFKLDAIHGNCIVDGYAMYEPILGGTTFGLDIVLEPGMVHEVPKKTQILEEISSSMISSCSMTNDTAPSFKKKVSIISPKQGTLHAQISARMRKTSICEIFGTLSSRP
jgi:hypothetical protein